MHANLNLLCSSFHCGHAYKFTLLNVSMCSCIQNDSVHRLLFSCIQTYTFHRFHVFMHTNLLYSLFPCVHICEFILFTVSLCSCIQIYFVHCFLVFNQSNWLCSPFHKTDSDHRFLVIMHAHLLCSLFHTSLLCSPMSCVRVYKLIYSVHRFLVFMWILKATEHTFLRKFYLKNSCKNLYLYSK